MSYRSSFSKDYNYNYQPKPGPRPTDSGAATCRWCGQVWQAITKMQYSLCCHAPRVKYGEVSLMRQPRNPFLRPMKRDRFIRNGKPCEVRMVDAGGVMLTDGVYVARDRWRGWTRSVKIVQRGDAGGSAPAPLAAYYSQSGRSTVCPASA